jgi:hypothetical protein
MMAKVASGWRLRRSTLIETGLFEMQGELYRNRVPRRRTVPPPDWHDELDLRATVNGFAVTARDRSSQLPMRRMPPMRWRLLPAGQPAWLWRL